MIPTFRLPVARVPKGLSSNRALMFDTMAALLIALAVTLVLVGLSAVLGVAPADDLDFLAIAYG
jgi:hypothetical protein